MDRISNSALKRIEPRLNVLVIGPTSTGRKGEGFAGVERVAERATDDWPSLVLGGLGSGEALIEAVRDQRLGVGDDGSEIVLDAGVTDKRKLVFAPEFARVLKVCRRDTSILGTILREAWDGRRLQNATRSAPLTASDYHVAVIAQITAAELRRLLDVTEAANGFLNRFLLVYSERPRTVPLPTRPDEAKLADLSRRVRQALEHGRKLGRVDLAPGAVEHWNAVYAALSRNRGGLVGELCARHATIALRLALVYAILDSARSIERDHLEAALAVCQYAEDTARHVFGDSVGDPIADRLHDAIRARPGITREELRADVLSRNVPADQLSRALELLAEAGLVTSKEEPTEGRPATHYYPASKKHTDMSRHGAPPSRTQRAHASSRYRASTTSNDAQGRETPLLIAIPEELIERIAERAAALVRRGVPGRDPERDPLASGGWGWQARI